MAQIAPGERDERGQRDRPLALLEVVQDRWPADQRDEQQSRGQRRPSDRQRVGQHPDQDREQADREAGPHEGGCAESEGNERRDQEEGGRGVSEEGPPDPAVDPQQGRVALQAARPLAVNRVAGDPVLGRDEVTSEVRWPDEPHQGAIERLAASGQRRGGGR